MDEFVWSMMECKDCEYQATEDKFLIDQQDEKTDLPEQFNFGGIPCLILLPKNLFRKGFQPSEH